MAEVVAEWREAWEFIRALSAQKRLDPADDVISDIASHGELTDDDVADTAIVLFEGGLETTGETMLALAAFDVGLATQINWNCCVPILRSSSQRSRSCCVTAESSG